MWIVRASRRRDMRIIAVVISLASVCKDDSIKAMSFSGAYRTRMRSKVRGSRGLSFGYIFFFPNIKMDRRKIG